jgi:hypothetical protein
MTLIFKSPIYRVIHKIKNATNNTFSKKAGHFNLSSQFFRKCSVGCIFYSVGPIITRE